jgi:hypothetical protein
MRRTIACVLGLLLIAAVAPGAAGKTGAHAETAQGAAAGWWRHSGDHGHLYYLDVYQWTSADGDHPQLTRAFFGQIPCGVSDRGRPAHCDYRSADYDRVKVQRFEIDPLLNSSHAVLRRGKQRAELTWKGYGAYSEPFVWQGAGEYLFPPSYVGVSAFGAVISTREARVKGRVFDFGFSRKELDDSGMVTFTDAGAQACTSSFFC